MLKCIAVPLTSTVDANSLAAPAQIFVVNTGLDYEDCNPGNGACDPGTWNVEHTVCTPAPGVCTLRAAIQECNASAGADEIVFSYVAQPIRPTTALPTITNPIVIDGIDKGHGGSVRLDGANIPPGANGLDLMASNSTIRGMTITGFRSNDDYNAFGIVLDGDSNVIESNYLGTNAAGESGLGNANGGLIIADSADGNRIGGTTPAQRNVISGNDGHGIQIGNALNDVGGSNNRIIGNYIGVAPDGQTALPNGLTGVSIFYATSTGNQVGGTAAGERNVIAGNGQHGIGLSYGPSGTLIRGNFVGTNISGTIALPNANVGVLLHQASNNTIGGTTAEARNIIAASGLSGVEISAPPFLMTATESAAAINAPGAPPAAPVSCRRRRSHILSCSIPSSMKGRRSFCVTAPETWISTSWSMTTASIRRKWRTMAPGRPTVARRISTPTTCIVRCGSRPRRR